MIIPDATEADYERDAEASYQCLDSYNNRISQVGTAWIRRAVAAEKSAEQLESQLDDIWRKANAMMAAIEGRSTPSSTLAPVAATEPPPNPPAPTGPSAA